MLRFNITNKMTDPFTVRKEALLEMLGEGLQQRAGFKFMNLVQNNTSGSPIERQFGEL
jgi:hypothetical protein